MSDFYLQFGGKDRFFSYDDVLAGINALSNSDMSDFFETHVKGVKPVPFAEYLKLAAVESKTGTTGLQLNPQSDQTELHRKM